MGEPSATPRRRPVTIVCSILALVALASLCACATGRRAQRETHEPPLQATSDAYGRIHLPVGARVLVIGDDYVGPPDALPGATLKSGKKKIRIGEPYTVALAKALGPQVTVIPRTQSGARVEQLLADFASLPKADVIVMLFGPGDAWGGPMALPVAQFSTALRQLLAKAQATGSLLVVVAPPPVSAPKLNTAAITAYRNAMILQAGLVGASVIEFDPKFRDVSHLWSDGIHLDTPGSRAVGRNVAAQFVAPGAPAR